MINSKNVEFSIGCAGLVLDPISIQPMGFGTITVRMGTKVLPDKLQGLGYEPDTDGMFCLDGEVEL